MSKLRHSPIPPPARSRPQGAHAHRDKAASFRFTALACAVAAICVSAGSAVAQCVMCGRSAEYAGGGPDKAYATLATASLILLLPALSLLAGAGALLWKYRKAPR